MMIKQKMRAKRCLNQIRTDTCFESPSSTHSWSAVREPTQPMVKRPTHLTLTVAPRLRPVAASQNHQLGLKA